MAPADGDTPARLRPSIDALHDEVSRFAGDLALIHGARLHCRRGCASCCVDDITVFEVEAAVIREHYPGLLATGRPRRSGACAFLDGEDACRIYPHRPYVCRTQGLPLRWIDEDDDGAVTEMRDICPLNEEGPPLERLPGDQCWTIGRFEARLARLQIAADGGAMRRVALRDLFALPSD